MVRFGEFEPRDLRYCIPLVCRFEGACQQLLLADRLRSDPRVHARRAQEQQFPDAVRPCGMDHIRLQRQIIVNEFRRISAVGENAPNPRRGKKYILWTSIFKEAPYGLLISQIQFRATADNQVGKPFGAQPPADGGTYEATVSGDKNTARREHPLIGSHRSLNHVRDLP